MNIERFKQIIAAYGGDPGRWPGEERAQAIALLAQSSEASNALEEEVKLDHVLEQSSGGDVTQALLTQILGSAASTLEGLPLAMPEPIGAGWSWEAFFSSVDAIDWSWRSVMQPSVLLGCVALLGLTTGIFAPEALEQAVYGGEIEEGFWRVAFDESVFSLEEIPPIGDVK